MCARIVCDHIVRVSTFLKIFLFPFPLFHFIFVFVIIIFVVARVVCVLCCCV